MHAYFAFAGLLWISVPQLPAAPIEGITFAGKPNDVYIPARVVAAQLGLQVGFDPKQKSMTFDGKDVETRKHLYDGTKLVLLKDLAAVGGQVNWVEEHKNGTVSVKDKSVGIVLQPKRVVVDLAKQELEAYQGNFLVFSSHVSTGKEGKNTPPGEFKVGPVKQKMHHSALYDNAPMPWSVQVNGNVFIHGFKSVPKHPASHGCIRVPISAAHWFYGWVDIGTPVSITGKWLAKGMMK
jgi:lipoprotein-anchoring transpeptidase ErfK/SrfK